MKKKFLSLLCAAAMVFSLAACGTKTDTTYAGQTLTGRVTAMDSAVGGGMGGAQRVSHGNRGRN